ncbi:LAETG motif-containing sortase-dependent surface protein [Streptomyces coeruleorubidus]|uniref:LAETG motif-containing sortase-dependent surface protein n=2 Tax=Streptomyces coeruleorubidus TaxID=116188 RepID=A0ABZ0KA76_STRC4|nr:MULTISPECIES: LAETG motif-containing sortase-dependent surface protein [Streptomyces]WOT34809.1 LAETG motif-containing sortase-dependent surface protein [Streptomyces coeruleorubidus]
MKLRRAMAAAAATAVIAPVALLAAPAAYATDETTPTPSPSVSESTSETSPSPSTSVSESAPETSPSPSTSVSESAPETSPSPSTSVSESAPEPSTSAPEESETPDPEPSVCEDTKVDVSITGLPGKIAAGSGWHKFSLNVANNSDSTLNDLDFFAGASPDKNGEELFSSKQVQLQAWDPQDKIWVDLNEGGYAVGYVGYTDELKPEYQVNIPLRLNVSKSAPVGAGFSLGATIYGDNDDECIGFGDVSYKFQIVAAGTDTGGTKPQEGGKAPVTDEKPSGNTPEVTGSLAETGSSSALPMISLVGGAAVVAGAGAIFVVRRRKAGVQA